MLRRADRSTLAQWVTVINVGVIVYASLQPFSGWTPLPPQARFFLWQWPQRVIVNDVLINVIGYLPFGAALALAWPTRWGRRRRWMLSVAAGAALSLAMESAQMWLPTRYASTVDVITNTLGTGLGAALGLLLTVPAGLGRAAQAMRERWVVPGATGELMLALLALWLLAQINPAIPLFAATYHPGQQAALEPAVLVVELAQTASALIGIGLFTDLTMRRRSYGGFALVAVIALAVLLKLLAALALLKPLAWDEWLRPGHALGLAGGAFALMLLFWLPRRVKSVLAGIALLTGVLSTLLLPDFVTAKAPLSIFNWNYGHLLHLNGLTRTIILVWPFIATAVLLWRFGAMAESAPKDRHRAATPKMPS
ncbi:MAG: VanZ family protein [Burkholderiales bacterium]|nr:VanZ family protein [Burkholderiales bacterium]